MQQSHTEIFETDVSGKNKRVFLRILWDNHRQEYVMGLEVSLGACYAHETIYFDRQTAKDLSHRLVAALHIIQLLDAEKSRPLRNHLRAMEMVKFHFTLMEALRWIAVPNASSGLDEARAHLQPGVTLRTLFGRQRLHGSEARKSLTFLEHMN